MKRVRYFKQEDGSFKTKQIQAAHDLVTIKTIGLAWEMTDSSGLIVQHGEAKNQIEMKKAIKKALATEGAGFLDEIRSMKKD